MTDTPAHTPLPWVINHPFNGDIKAEGTEIASCFNESCVGEEWIIQGPITVSYEEQIANADFIVRACNSHYALIDALRETKIGMECAAGCIEGVTQEDAYSEILSFGGTSLAAAYDRIYGALSQAGGVSE